MFDLSWLTPVLAVGGSFASEHAELLVREHHIAAIVDLRAEACHRGPLLERHGLALLHLPTEDHCAIERPMLDEGVTFVRRYLDAGRRVFIHCHHGIGRSALLALCVMVDRGFTPLAALQLAKRRRDRVSPSPAQYEAWAGWLQDRGLKVPAFHAFATIAYRHVRTS